ncbi:putative beta-lysine N-acetyltransferase [Anaerobacillus sp. MEB173]|uniref:putative beta-lysine N-acetyltransferase n=1 Tax=Anaerobacillus sp. MEB173 TaxID=3383345 RepID=UPI003F8E8305
MTGGYLIKNQIDIDPKNERIVAYVIEAPETEIFQLKTLQQQHMPGKTIVYTLPGYVKYFQKEKYQLEGQIQGFFNGQDGMIVSKFHQQERKVDNDLSQRERIIQIALADKKKYSISTTATGYTIERIQQKDIAQLSALYRTVFERYPTNIFDAKYIEKSMNDDYFFVVAKQNDQIVCAASAMVNPYNSAEITDCATDPSHRGKNLLAPVIVEIEKQLQGRHVHHYYSLTRALSVGMNVTIKRLGYHYEGTLVKNCVISTGFEDMNIWVKKGDN